MAIETASNDAFHHLLLEHLELMRDISELRKWWFEVQQFGIPRYGEMGSRLKNLCDHLEAHFAEEEAGGYMAGVLAIAPRFAEKAEELRGQHRRFLDVLAAFIEKLHATVPPFACWDETRQQLEEFLSALRQHESAENAMIQSAFNEDTAPTD